MVTDNEIMLVHHWLAQANPNYPTGPLRPRKYAPVKFCNIYMVEKLSNIADLASSTN